MGTDIHLYFEKKNAAGNWEPYPIDGDLPDNRDYKVFALLADIRNGFGFGGIQTFDRVTPCFPNRGIPKDTSYKEFRPTDDDDDGSKPWVWLGDHGFTYATVAELKAVNWKTIYRCPAFLNREQYQEYKESGEIKSFCWDSWGRDVKKCYDYELFEKDLSYTLCQVTFDQDLSDCEWVKFLNKHFPDSSNDDVRVLMGFDS